MSPALDALRRPGAAPMFAAGVLGRAAVGMVPLGVTFLVVGQTGSYGLAGAVGATTTLPAALVARYSSRLVDRLGQSRVIPVLLALHVVALLGLVVAVTMGAAQALWFVLAATAGSSAVNLGAMTRTRWAGIATDPEQLSAAYAVESMADEFAFMLGPVVATMLAIAVAPAAPVLVGLLLLVTGGLLLAAQRRTQPLPGPPDERGRGRLFAHPGMSVLFFLMLLMGVVFGTNNLTTVAFAQSIGRPELTGVLLAVFPLASLLGGVLLSSVRRTWPLTTQIRTALATLTVALVPLAFVTSPWVFAMSAFLIGLSVPAVMVGTFALVAEIVPRSRLTEALALSTAGITIGMSVAAAAAGRIIDSHGPHWAFPVSAVAALIGLLWFAWRSGVLLAAEERTDPVVPTEPGQSLVGIARR